MVKKRIQSAVPLYAAGAVWLIFGFILPMYRSWAVILALAVSVIAAFIAKILFPGREVEVLKRAASGNSEVDHQIEEGRATIRSLHEANDAIPDEKISAQILRMENAAAGIFNALEEDASRAPQVRRFMNYYLPTADKLLTNYRRLSAVSGGENVSAAVEGIERSMEMIATAFEKQLDALYRDNALDIETDIEVLETMIKADGLSGM